MHPARLDMLAVRLAPARKVLRCDDGASVITFDLECGHTSRMAPHFDPRSVTRRNCTDCGIEAVKADPQYRGEFEAAAPAPAVEPVASVVGEAAPAPAPVAMMAQPVQQAQSVVPLGGRYVPLGDGGVEWVPDAPAMVPQPCQQQQARARGRTPQPARGERRYVTVRDTETGDVHRVLTSVARVGVAVVIFTPSNRHRQGAHNGMLITHDDIRKAWVFNDEAEARRMLSRNRTPGERVIRAELVSDPAVA